MTLRPLAAPSARNRITISKNCWRKGGDLFCFLNNETMLLFQQSCGDKTQTHPKRAGYGASAVSRQRVFKQQLNCTALDSRTASHLHPRTKTISHLTHAHTLRATSLVKVAGGAEGWTCVSYRHLLHDTQGLSRHVRATARHLSLYVSKSILTTCSWAVWMD